MGSPLLCEECLCAAHTGSPLHRIQRWNGTFFEKYSLMDAGFVVQLGHDDLVCPNPRNTLSTLTVIDVSGIHRVAVRFCDCANMQTSRTFVQVLRARWWPATVQRPRTAVTLRTCELFHALTLQGKMNAYDFWHGPSRVTDGTGLQTPKDHYKDFIRVMRFFRHIRMCKRGGRAHDPGGVAATEIGELVVECPACPQPGRNMPDGWETAPESERWKYALMLAVDANLKLKSKNRGLSDVALAPGWSYFVENWPYKEHVKKYIDEEEMKHCDSSFAAVDHANNPARKRFAVNGVGAVICARHCFYRKGGIADLQRGERYCNMDYAVLSTIARTAAGITMIVLSYDIACQYSKNFAARMLANYPQGFQINLGNVTIVFVVPKFHLLAHGQQCQVDYNLHYTNGVGRTCGEGIEAGWADTNGSALSTREMSPESRHEGLDDFFGAINWRKAVSLALATQKKIFEESNESIPRTIHDRWEAMILNWERDRSLPNPYDEPELVTTLADVRLELAQEEAADAAKGNISLHEMSASVFLGVGLELEDTQRAIRVKAKDIANKTSIEKLALQERRNTLQHRIRAWQTIQKVYMPAVAALLATKESAAAAAEAAATPAAMWTQGFSTGLIVKYRRLRLGQAEDALHNLRRQLRIRTGLIHYKHVFVDGSGQKSNTRARTQIAALQDRIKKHASQYRVARDALFIVWPDGPWVTRLQELKDEHLRAPRDEEQLGEGHRELLWIWRAIPHEARDLPGRPEDMSEDEVHEGLRVDWAWARARVYRWDEEITHLQEEMQRAVKFLRWKAVWWSGRAGLRSIVSPGLQDGLHAYAARHAAMYNGLASHFQSLWTVALTAHELPVPWPAESTPTTAPTPGAAEEGERDGDGGGDGGSDSESEASDGASEAEISDDDLDE
ncbi:hypothetical protein FA95DRAFT_1584271 [Auriscalpium vulgare]|uniref:Uncharacterized protein n=1 Tax=Auriscalpium vulgare TaxID=40419 RepID=A0ACB8RG67_9AGAM|nr:hypothetical protein FA95DRAFT_1584271 [Auriscalpium vulgare]